MTKNNKPSLVEELTDAIAKKIISGYYQAGELLPGENTLSVEWNASRTSVRGALQCLAAKQLVITEPKRGTRVMSSHQWDWLDMKVLNWISSIKKNAEYSRELFEARLIFEPGATALAAMNATSQDLAEIEQHYLQMKKAANNNDRQLFNNHDLLFHRALLKASHNSFMIALGDLLSSIMLVVFDATLDEELSPHNVALEEHFNVFESVRLRKPEEARAQMRNIVLCGIEKQLKETTFTKFLI